MSSLSNAASMVRLVLVFVLFPVFFVFFWPRIDFVAALLDGDRSQWMTSWAIAAVFEWGVLIIVLLTYAGQREELSQAGLPRPGPGTLLVAAVLVGAAVWAAIALPGMSDERLARIPYGATLFLPPADMESRLFWVFMSATAAICEEVLFRGVAITQVRKLTGSLWVAVLISAVAFAFYHGGLDQGPGIFGIRFTIALVLSGLFLWRKRLTSAMAVHFAIDASALAAI